MLIKSQVLDKLLDSDELLAYFPVPYIFATADGFFVKKNKAKILHDLLETYTDKISYPNECFLFEDGNAMVHVLKDLQPTFGEICLMALDQMVHENNFVFSTDSYQPHSIKSHESLRLGPSLKIILIRLATREP